MNIVIQLSKFMFILLILLYCLEAYTYFRKKTPEKKKALLKRQVTIIFVTVILGYVLIFINTMNVLILLLGGGILVYFIITLSCYRLIYPKASMGEHSQLEIVNTANLIQKTVCARTPMIVGAANDYDDAVQLVIKITEDVLKETGDADIRKYFEEK